jgi:hypothetical protein
LWFQVRAWHDTDARIDVVARITDKRSFAPLNAAIIEKHVLSLASVVPAVHRCDVFAWRIGIDCAIAVNSIVAVSGNGIFRRG